MRRGLNPHLLTVLVAATVSLAGLLGSAMPAAAQTAATRGALFDGEFDTTLPAPSPLNQLFTSANDGWVHFPFAAADILPLLRSSTYNGTADARNTTFTVATPAAVDGYEGDIVSWDELWFGLSPSRDAAQCDFGTVVAVVNSNQTDPETIRFTDGSVQAWSRARYLIGSTRTPGAKLGHLRLAPDPFIAGKHLCAYRYAAFREVNNGSVLFLYDGQISPIVVSAAPIVIDFAGSRYTPETVAEEDPEPAEADEPEAEQEADPDGPEADDADADAAADEDVDVEESTTRADPEAPEATDTDPDADGPAADGGDTAGVEAAEQPTVPAPAETAPAPAPDDDAVTAAAGEDVPTAPDDPANDDGGDGALVPTLAGLIGVLLAGIALVLVRRRRRRDDRAEDSTAAPADQMSSGLGVADEGGAEGDAEAP